MAKGPVAPRILVVDDEPMVPLRITRALRDEGYEVTAAANGRAALEATQTAQPPFDLIVTNTWIGGLSDAELISRLRVDFPTVPILQVDDFARHKSSAELRPDVTTIYKPFSIATLRKAVAEVLVAGMEQAVTREPQTLNASDAARSEVPLAALQEAVEGVYGGTATYRSSEYVQEAFEGKTVWEGDVYVFALSGHPTASTCYTWSSPVEGSHRRRFFAVLHEGPVKSAHDAVRASIVQAYQEETKDAH